MQRYPMISNCTMVEFTSFLSGAFAMATIVNPLKKKQQLVNPTIMQSDVQGFILHF